MKNFGVVERMERHLRHQLLISPGRDKTDGTPVADLVSLIEMAKADGFVCSKCGERVRTDQEQCPNCNEDYRP